DRVRHRSLSGVRPQGCFRFSPRSPGIRRALSALLCAWRGNYDRSALVPGDLVRGGGPDWLRPGLAPVRVFGRPTPPYGATRNRSAAQCAERSPGATRPMTSFDPDKPNKDRPLLWVGLAGAVLAALLGMLSPHAGAVWRMPA